jgi:hypothetical protein
MPHHRGRRNSCAKRQAREKKVLSARITNLNILKQKKLLDSQIVKLKDISLGSLREQYKRTQNGVHPAIRRKAKKFPTYKSSDTTPLLIYGSDGGLIAARVRLNNPRLVAQISDAIDALPPLPSRLLRNGVKRSQGQSRHYGVWCPYMKTPKRTAEHRHDGARADDFIRLAQPVFHEMSALIGSLAPKVFEEYQLLPLPEDAERACGAWAACAINNGGVDADETTIHRDVKESRYGYSCVFACGDYTEGNIILYELECKVELRPGDMLLFPDSIINHNNEKAYGKRKSIVCFTQENVQDYWARKYRHPKRRPEPKA